MADLCGRLASLHVLSFAGTPKPWLFGVTGALTTFLAAHPAVVPAAADYHSHARDNLHFRLQAFKDYCRTTSARHGLVSIENCPTVQLLAEALNAALACAPPHAVLVMEGIIPPAPPRNDPATPHDARWTFKAVLEQAGATVHAVPAGPGGTLVATGLRPIDVGAATALVHRLYADLPAGSDVPGWLGLSAPEAVLQMAEQSFARQIADTHVELITDPADYGVVSTEIDPFAGWDRPPAAFVVDLSTHGHDTAPLHHHQLSKHGVSIDEFYGVRLIGRDIIVAGAPAADACPAYTKNKVEAAIRGSLHTAAQETAWTAATRIVAHGGRHYYPRQALEAAQPLDRPGFLNTPDEDFNYGMWLLYSVPGVRLFQSIKDRYPLYMASAHLPWARRMLLDLGIAEHELLILDPQAVYKTDAVATMRQTYRSLSLPPSDMQAFDEVADRAVAEGGPTPEKIYISRMSLTRRGSYRALVNEPELAAALVDLGFVVVEPETMPLLAQARTFRNARAIVGLGGAGMFNTAFCRPGTRLVDIESNMNWINAHASLFASRGLEYGLILGDPDPTDPAPVHKRWSIDLPRALEHIRSFV